MIHVVTFNMWDTISVNDNLNGNTFYEKKDMQVTCHQQLSNTYWASLQTKPYMYSTTNCSNEKYNSILHPFTPYISMSEILQYLDSVQCRMSRDSSMSIMSPCGEILISDTLLSCVPIAICQQTHTYFNVKKLRGMFTDFQIPYIYWAIQMSKIKCKSKPWLKNTQQTKLITLIYILLSTQRLLQICTYKM